jgi:hypothetical protein
MKKWSVNSNQSVKQSKRQMTHITKLKYNKTTQCRLAKIIKSILKILAFIKKSLTKIIEGRLQFMRFKIITFHTVLDYLVSCLVP